MALDLSTGTVLKFKRSFEAERYGATATVVKSQDVFTGHHPGHVYTTYIDLVTANGTKLQWPRSWVSARFKAVG